MGHLGVLAVLPSPCPLRGSANSYHDVVMSEQLQFGQVHCHWGETETEGSLRASGQGGPKDRASGEGGGTGQTQGSSAAGQVGFQWPVQTRSQAHPSRRCQTRPGGAGWTWDGAGRGARSGQILPCLPATGAEPGQLHPAPQDWGRGVRAGGPYHTTGKRMAPQHTRSTRNRICFQSP